MRFASAALIVPSATPFEVICSKGPIRLDQAASSGKKTGGERLQKDDRKVRQLERPIM